LLGSKGFIDYIRENYINGLKANRDLPSIGILSSQIAIKDVCRTVRQVIAKNSRLSRNVEIYLCRKLTGEKLKSIGTHFQISDAAVSQVCKRLDKKL
jgi:hypothetical protein